METIITVLMAIVIVICIAGIFLFGEFIKKDGWSFMPITIILLLIGVIGFLSLGICYIQGYGDCCQIKQLMKYFACVDMFIVVILFIVVGLSIFKIGMD